MDDAEHTFYFYKTSQVRDTRKAVLMNLPPVAKTTGDVTSIGIGVGAFVEALPHVAALLVIVWWGIRIYETRTAQKWIGRTPRTRRDDGRPN